MQCHNAEIVQDPGQRRSNAYDILRDILTPHRLRCVVVAVFFALVIRLRAVRMHDENKGIPVK